MSNPSITFVVPWYGYFAGGAEVAARSLAEQLVQRGFAVQVLTTCCRSPFESWWRNTLADGIETINGVLVRRFPVDQQGEEIYHDVNYRIVHGMDIDEVSQRQFVQHSINSEALIEYAKQHTEGHLVIGMPYTQGLIYCLIQALQGRASIIPCFHDEPQLQWITTAEMLQWSRRILFLSVPEKKVTIQHYGHRIGRRLVESEVIGLGVELPTEVEKSLAGPSTAEKIRQQYQLPQNFFVYVGRKDLGKNILLMIKYFKNYCHLRKDERSLVFLGGGDASLVPLGDPFIDLGFLPEADKYSIISHSKGLINLSKNESFSLVLMEAWLCGVAVIVHQDCEVTTGHCLKSQGGISIASCEEFNAALQTLSDKDISQKLARSGKRYVRSQYSWDCVIDRFLRAIESE